MWCPDDKSQSFIGRHPGAQVISKPDFQWGGTLRLGGGSYADACPGALGLRRARAAAVIAELPPPPILLPRFPPPARPGAELRPQRAAPTPRALKPVHTAPPRPAWRTSPLLCICGRSRARGAVLAP